MTPTTSCFMRSTGTKTPSKHTRTARISCAGARRRPKSSPSLPRAHCRRSSFHAHTSSGGERVSAPSYVHGASPVPLLGETIGENLRRTVERVGDHEALVVGHQKYRASYAELWDQTTRAARGLLARGV